MDQAIVSFLTPEFFNVKRYKYFYLKQLYHFKTFDAITKLSCMHLKVRGSEVYERRVSVGGEGIHRFHLALKGQQRKNFLPLNLKIWAPHKVDQLKKRVNKSRSAVPLSGFLNK